MVFGLGKKEKQKQKEIERQKEVEEKATALISATNRIRDKRVANILRLKIYELRAKELGANSKQFTDKLKQLPQRIQQILSDITLTKGIKAHHVRAIQLFLKQTEALQDIYREKPALRSFYEPRY